LSSGKLGTTADSKESARREVLEKAGAGKPDFVIIGPEEPLAAGFADSLRTELGIPSIGPTQLLARVESSKSFTRTLLEKYQIRGNPRFRIFESMAGVDPYLRQLERFVVKPDGLTGGKGVKVSDAHLYSVEDGVRYCQELFDSGEPRVLVEEKLEGEEFSLQSFSDGVHVVDMPIVQDHKRVGVGDTGPNTGGMGSYSCSDHSLPFLSAKDVQEASAINSEVAQALREETGDAYKGILYGGFIATRNGIRLIEYNARFGDPEALNVLSLLETDFADICEAIITGKLDEVPISFAKLATVCKYVVPDGYPDAPAKGRIDLSKVPKESAGLKTFLAAVEPQEDDVYLLTGSRAIAFVGIGRDVEEAEKIAEEAARAVEGPVYHRPDIGTAQLIDARKNHMRVLRDGVGSLAGSPAAH
jgi:phosphoribosylamine--glycine ligase